MSKKGSTLMAFNPNLTKFIKIGVGLFGLSFLEQQVGKDMKKLENMYELCDKDWR